MKVNSEYNKNISFNGFWNKNCVKKGLEFASDYGATFAATTTLAFSTIIRPLVIQNTPQKDTNDKKIAIAKSIVSGILEFVLTLGLSIPIVNGFNKIKTNPTKYLNAETIKNLKIDSTSLKDSKIYSLATQLFKLGIGFAVVLPKAILTASGIPFLMDNFLNTEEKKSSTKNLSFKGKNNDFIATTLGKILNNKKLQTFSTKHKDSNFPLHIFALKDIFATGAFIHQSNKSCKIKEDQKKFLTINSIISTTLSLISSYTIDHYTDNYAEKFISKIKEQNLKDPKLLKYIEGFKIIKPILILATVYYTIIPVLSVLWTDKLKNKTLKL